MSQGGANRISRLPVHVRGKYSTRDEARADVFNYIEHFYNRQRRHGYVGNISPVEFEERTLWA